MCIGIWHTTLGILYAHVGMYNYIYVLYNSQTLWQYNVSFKCIFSNANLSTLRISFILVLLLYIYN